MVDITEEVETVPLQIEIETTPLESVFRQEAEVTPVMDKEETEALLNLTLEEEDKPILTRAVSEAFRSDKLLPTLSQVEEACQAVSTIVLPETLSEDNEETPETVKAPEEAISKTEELLTCRLMKSPLNPDNRFMPKIVPEALPELI